MKPFMASMGFQPPLFPAQQEEVAVSSVQVHLRQWKATQAALSHSTLQNQRIAERH